MPNTPLRHHTSGRDVRLLPPPVGALVVFLVLAAPASALTTHVPVQASLDAQALDVEPSEAVLEAYLLGFSKNPNTPPETPWSFQAEQVEVVKTVERWQRIGVVETKKDSWETRFVHDEAQGGLLETHSLAYLALTGPDPHDPNSGATVHIQTPHARFQPVPEIHFDSAYSSTDDHLPRDENNMEYRFERAWPAVEHTLESSTGPILVRGDFRVIVFDMEFRVTNASGTTDYWTGHGGHRGLDTVPSPVEEYEDARAELILRNATFTLNPRQHTATFYLKDAMLGVEKTALIQGATGTLDLNGETERLHRSYLQVQAHDLDIHLTAARPSGLDPARLEIGLSGTVNEIILDGRPLEAKDPASQRVATPDTPGFTWIWLSLIPAIALALTLAFRYSEPMQARKWPAHVARRAERAMDRGRYHRAKLLSALVLDRHPGNTKSIAVHAMSILQQGTPMTAAEFLVPLIGTDSDHGTLSLIYCISLREAGLIDEARASLRQTVRRFPGLLPIILETDLADLHDDR